MNVRHEDKIRIGCVFVGALLGSFVFAPLSGGTPAVLAAIGVGLGWSIAKTIIGHLDAPELAKRETEATATQAQSDAEFAKALMDHDASDAAPVKGSAS